MKARLIGVAVMLFGLVFVALGYSSLQKARASTSWSRTMGTVNDSDVEEHEVSSGSSSNKRNRRDYQYTVQVFYSYEVDGVEYSSQRISFETPTYSSEARAERMARSYREGSQVAVRYDPRDPSEAVLRPGVIRSQYLFPVVGLLFALIGLYVTIRGPGKKDRGRPRQGRAAPRRTR